MRCTSHSVLTVSLCTLAAVSSAPPTRLAAQAPGGVHPHTAPLAAGYSSADIRETGMMMNHPDGVWNNGEGFGLTGPADTGGLLSFDDGSNLQSTHIFEYLQQNPPWEDHLPSYASLPSPVHMDRLRGRLASSASDPNEAAFELFAPKTFSTEPEQNTVIVISLFATVPDPSTFDGGRLTYPGYARDDGLIAAGQGIRRPIPASDFVANYSGTPAVGNLNVISGYIVPRTAYRNLTANAQRALQLERAIHLILKDPTRHPPGMQGPLDPQAQLPVVVAGASFGGLTAQVLTMYFPDRFHGGVSSAFPGILRRAFGDQEGYGMVAALTGLSKLSGIAYGDRDTLELSAFLRQIDRDYYDASFVHRFQRGMIYRPHYFVMADEDTVTNGTDWRAVLDGTRAYDSEGAAAGSFPLADAYWSVLDKACHDSYYYRFPRS